MAAGLISIPKTKNKTPRTVRLTREAQRTMKRYFRALGEFELRVGRDPAEWVWPSMSHYAPMTPNGISQMFRERRKVAKVDLTPHTCARRPA